METRELQKAKIPLIRTKQKEKTHPGSQSRRYQTWVSVFSQKEECPPKIEKKTRKENKWKFNQEKSRLDNVKPTRQEMFNA